MIGPNLRPAGRQCREVEVLLSYNTRASAELTDELHIGQTTKLHITADNDYVALHLSIGLSE
jgi:hypothetical protein